MRHILHAKPLLLGLCAAFALSGVAWGSAGGVQDQDPGPTPEHPAQRMDRDPVEDRARAGFPAQHDALRGGAPGDSPIQTERDAPERAQEDAQDEPDAQALVDPTRPPPGADQAATDRELQELARYVGQPLLDPNGEEMGEIEQIVRHAEDGSLHVVVSSGGVFGLGARRAVVPAAELEPEEQAVRLRRQSDAEGPEQLAEYRPEDYEQVAEDAAGERADDAWGGDRRG
jgi:hypothetical protein